MLNVFFNDGGRSLLSGGYGEFSRGVIAGLACNGVRVYIQNNFYNSLLENESKEFVKILNSGRVLALDKIEGKFDISIDLCSINTVRDINEKELSPSILITGSPFLGIKKEILKKVEKYSAVFYSGEVDKLNFSKYSSYNLPQPLDFSKRFSSLRLKRVNDLGLRFIFVGTFNYWKGVDLAVRGFLLSDAPDKSQLLLKVGLKNGDNSLLKNYTNFIKHKELFVSLVCSYVESVSGITNLLVMDIASDIIEVSVGCGGSIRKIVIDMRYSDSEEMEKAYLNSDILLATSRGETWSMPVVEALSQGLDVIFPEHYGCSKFISKLNLIEAQIVKSEPMRFDDYSFLDRSSGGGRLYLNENINYFEVDEKEYIDSLNKSIKRIIKSSSNDLDFMIEESRIRLRKFSELLSWNSIGKVYLESILEVVNKNLI